MASLTVSQAILFLYLLTLTAAEEQQGSADEILLKNVIFAHGIIAVLVWVVLAPIGVILRRHGGKMALRVHGVWQISTLLIFTIAVGMGIWLAQGGGIFNHYHPIVGFIVFGLALIQPLVGLLSHFLYKKRQRPTIVGRGHAYLGFVVITTGMINGGLGLDFNRKHVTDNECIAYGVVVTMIFACFLTYLNLSRSKDPKKEEMAKKKDHELSNGTQTPHNASLGDADQNTV